jgi:hypothetical protein
VSPEAALSKQCNELFRTELADDFSEQLAGVYINRLKETEAGITDLMWDWSSTPSICPPKVGLFTLKNSFFRLFFIFDNIHTFYFSYLITYIHSIFHI